MSTQKQRDVDVIDRADEEYKEPSLFNVIFLNDDFTPQDFVVALLVHVFKHEQSVAKRIMLQVHNGGRGIAGTYTKEIAETKAAKCTTLAQENQFPLEVIIESRN